MGKARASRAFFFFGSRRRIGGLQIEMAMRHLTDPQKAPQRRYPPDFSPVLAHDLEARAPEDAPPRCLTPEAHARAGGIGEALGEAQQPRRADARDGVDQPG